MDTNIKNYITKTEKMEWKPLQEEGVDTKGLFVKILRLNGDGRPPSFLLKFEARAKYPYHNHPGGEELFVRKGSCYVNKTELNAGDYLYTPPGFKHSVKSETGCELLFIVPEEVEIISEETENL